MWEVYLWDMLLFGMQNTNKFKELGEVKWNLFQLCDGDDVQLTYCVEECVEVWLDVESHEIIRKILILDIFPHIQV